MYFYNRSFFFFKEEAQVKMCHSEVIISNLTPGKKDAFKGFPTILKIKGNQVEAYNGNRKSDSISQFENIYKNCDSLIPPYLKISS